MGFSELIEPLRPYADALVLLAGRARVAPRVTSTLRTYSQQQRLYRSFVRGETRYPVAPPGTSAHEYGYAFDMVVDSQENLHDLGQVWRSWGGVWNPSDEVHFEYPGFKPTGAEKAKEFLASIPDQAQLASKTCDFFAGKWWVSLLSAGWSESEILELLSSPCSTILATLQESGLLQAGPSACPWYDPFGFITGCKP